MDFIYKYEDIEKLKDQGDSIAFIDVRTPREYKNYTIPGAYNIPVLLDDEYEQIGILYKEGKIEGAKQKGVEFISKRLGDIYQEIIKLTKEYSYTVLFCSRGGYRSSVIFNTLRSLNTRIFKLDGGYKHYRKYVNEKLPKLIEEARFIVLNGGTGSGKTEILKALEKKGKAILDLEARANHRGSLLGHIGLGECHSQKLFESYIYEDLRKNIGSYIFCEGESKRIGRVLLPGKLKEKMNQGIHILIDTPINHRIDIINREYVISNSNEELIEGVNKLNKYISKERIQELQNQIKTEKYTEVIRDLIEKYYDNTYDLNKNCQKTFENIDSSHTADEIIRWHDCELVEDFKLNIV